MKFSEIVLNEMAKSPKGEITKEAADEIIELMVMSHQSDDYYKFGNGNQPRIFSYAEFITKELKQLYPEFKFKTKFETGLPGEGFITVGCPAMGRKHALVKVLTYGKNGTLEAIRGNLRFRLYFMHTFEANVKHLH